MCSLTRHGSCGVATGVPDAPPAAFSTHGLLSKQPFRVAFPNDAEHTGLARGHGHGAPGRRPVLRPGGHTPSTTPTQVS
jgi:hypothetical protein